MLGIKCDIDNDDQLPKKAERLDDQSEYILISSSGVRQPEPEEVVEETTPMPAQEEYSVDDPIKTSPSILLPDRDDTFDSILLQTTDKPSATSATSATNNAEGGTVALLVLVHW